MDSRIYKDPPFGRSLRFYFLKSTATETENKTYSIKPFGSQAITMCNSILLSILLTLSTFLLTATALPNHPTPPTGTGTTRYTPGSLARIIETMKLHSQGALSVGNDGVLRSFTPNGTVLDYYQLDPDQLSRFAANQLAAWEASGMNVPESVMTLAAAKKGTVDGRLVTDVKMLFEPEERPDIAGAKAGDGDGHLIPDSAAKEQREMFEQLKNHPAKRNCVGRPCPNLSACLPDCMACFFPGGPPFGVCFLT
ncbi:uncharacterized protein PADG_03746 [Paracoccidioides brasiliensis Pb18]|uniref:Uncharacterized protein n=1 Tax=Paracoccidioides brasiliensis (strain Pb18) TaxID=502780 RepID=C1G910_PARBD|nr:uncharacterized protein PADG_03746 [Paracoccidioides brasiliensis Pb18]EEH47662.2 hypothetical protein PADG_03746 [Paracoccidioides brasiliensis Pb18]